MKTELINLFKSGTMLSKSNKKVNIHSNITLEQALFMEKLVKKLKPNVYLEVGLAFGLSALTVLGAMKLKKSSRFICMDPSQYKTHKDKNIESHGDTYNGMGILNLRRFGYSKITKFYNDTSQMILPKLVYKKNKIDFAFVDGWHTFDHTLVDFFYIDQMLNTGGVVVFHDVGYTSINALCNFILLNRNYEIYSYYPKKSYALSRYTEIIAFRKIKPDNRNWMHFVEFWNYSISKSVKQKVKSLFKSKISG